MTRWILLRGLTREAAHWGELPQALARRLGPGHQVQTLDLPGNGSLHREPSPATVAQMVEACRRQLPAGEPCVLVAMSLGAMVAIEWSRIAPQEVSSCMLINTSGGGGSTPFWQRLQPRNYLPLLGLLRPGLPPSARECRVLALTSAAPAHHAHVLPYWARIATQRPVSSCNALRQLMAAARYAAPATRPQVPMLLIASAGDRLVSPRCSQDLAQRWGVPLRMHPWAGHDLPLDDPQWLLDRVTELPRNCHREVIRDSHTPAHPDRSTE